MNKVLVELRERCENYNYSTPHGPAHDLIADLLLELERVSSQAQGEPVAWMYQHSETGRSTCIWADEREHFEKMNPRWGNSVALYTHPTPHEGQTVEDYAAIHRIINGAIKSSITAHGDITLGNHGSAGQRILGQLQVDGFRLIKTASTTEAMK